MRQPVPFGKYLLLDRVSVGGMAEVFKAKSYGVEGFEKVIAIKRILPSMGEDRDFIKMFIDEAKIAGQLTHANICQIFELGRIDGAHFIAMEYIWGKDLLQIQNRFRKLGDRMPVSMACHMVSKVCEGLDYAHRKRDPLGRPLEIVHRDCSPQNVLVSYEGEVKIIDFGIAKAASRSSQTMAGVLKGKFGYMSPEQVRGLPLDRRSDIFALGTILYESLTGERLFQGESDFSTLEKVRNVDIVPPSHLHPDIPEQVEHIVMQALERDPEDRYQWCSEMQADLRAYLMSQDDVVTSKHLGAWLKQAFANELRRERKLMEDYKRLGRDGLIQGKPQAEARVDIVETLGEAGPVEGDPTMLGGPSFEDVVDEDIQPIRRAGSQSGDDFADEGPTELFGQIDHRVDHRAATEADPGSEVSDVIDEGDLLEVEEEAKVLVEAPATPSHALAAAAQAVFTPSGVSSVDSGAYPRLSDEPFFGSTSSVTPLPEPGGGRGLLRRKGKGRRPSLTKDIAIGVGLAVLVLGLFVGGKYLFFGAEPGTAVAEASGSGTIAVHVPDADPAEVWLNGRKAGVVSGGDTLTIDALQMGSYEVAVSRGSIKACERSVDLEAGKVEVITCAFPADPVVSVMEKVEPGALDPAESGDGDEDENADADAADTRAEVSAGNDEVDPGDEKKRQARRGDDRKRRASNTGDEKRRASNTGDEKRRASNTGGDDKGSSEKADKGYFLAYTTPWARVLIDGRDTGKMTPIAPRAKLALSPGKHTVTFVVGRQKFDYVVTIEPGQDTKLVKDLPVEN